MALASLLVHFSIMIMTSGSFPGVLSQSDAEERGQGKPLIFGGSNATRGEFPFVVGVQQGDTGRWCTGALIKLDTVLTAAHCLLERNNSGKFSQPETILVVAGIFWRFQIGYDDKDIQGVNAKEFIVHDDFFKNQTFLQNDVALIKLVEPFQSNSVIKPIALPAQNFQLKEFDIGNVIGWGHGDPNEIPMLVLQKAGFAIRNVSVCREKYQGIYGLDVSNTFCADGPGKGLCIEDEGATFIVTGKGGTKVLYGLGVRSGGGYCKPEPAVFVKIPKFVGWIEENLQSSGMEYKSQFLIVFIFQLMIQNLMKLL